jgi:two-component system catabolic regulation response regulator CreB/two-component system response regulator ChvI
MKEVMRTMTTNQRILLVDDEPDLTTIFSMGLVDNGFKVDAFNDPVVALAEFKDGSYDLILLDYKMPNMNGFELFTEIRKIDRKVKVCFITAFEVYHEELRKQFHPVYDNEDIKLIQKPIEIDELVRQIREQLAS